MDKSRHKVFISYHHDDQAEVNRFIEVFDKDRNVFIARALGVDMANEIINSSDTDYVMQRIRELYLRNSTVTLVLIGKCTWARRYVDWEIQASLRHGELTAPNGLLGIVLPSVGKNPIAPDRLRKNLNTNEKDGYARCYWYPSSAETLSAWLDDAYRARTERADLIVNPRERFTRNKECP